MSKANLFKSESGERLYERIANDIRSDILEGRLSPREGISTEAELCKKFSVSRGPIRQAMDLLVKEKLISRTPGRGTFVNEVDVVSEFKSSDVFNVGVFIDNSSEAQWHGFISEIVDGLNVAARGSWPECRLSFQFHENPHEVGSEILNREDFNGIIFVPTGLECMNFLANPSLVRKKPIVSFFRQIDTSNISQFYVDHEEGAFHATDYLLRSGHERIGLVVIAPIQSRIDSRSRFDGYRRALNCHGIKFDATLVTDTGMTAAGVRSALNQMLNENSRPTALLIGGQALFNPCVKLLDAMKIKIPDDVSVIAFDDCIESEMHEPPISVVKQPFTRGARLAVERLIAEVKGTAVDAIKVALKPELIIRDSCSVMGNRQEK